MSDRIALIPAGRFIELARELERKPQLRVSFTPDEIRKINARAEVERARVDGTAKKLHRMDDLEGGDSYAEVLKVRDLTHPLDEIAIKARQATREFYREELNKKLPAERVVKLIKSAVLAKVSKRLNARGLEDIERALLALPEVYEFLLIEAVNEGGVEKDDDLGLFDAVLRGVAVKPRRFLLNEIAGRVLDAENIELDTEELSSLRDLIFERGADLRSGSLRANVLKLVDEGQRIGKLRDYIDLYAEYGEIDPDLFTPRIKREMARYLFARGVQIKERILFDSGKYDEYFALAYDYATSVVQGLDDPIDVARSKGSVSDWDFTIRRISESNRPIFRADAIKAAGALYTIYMEGEQMHVFDIADALLTQWHRGDLDIPDGEAAALLNRFEHFLEDRPTEEERQMHYKRIFNIGETDTLSGTVVNEEFPRLWDNMMYEVARYIDKTERYYTEEKRISRTPLYQTIEDLQYNLSEFMTGSAPKKTHEMYVHLQEALDIIGSEDVLNHMGGRRKSMLTVIERVGRAALGVSIPTTSLVTLAERGNDIFHFIAGFAAENVGDDEFERFLDAAKACIVKQAGFETAKEGPYYEDEPAYNSYKNGNGRRSQNGSPARLAIDPNGRTNGSFDDWES